VDHLTWLRRNYVYVPGKIVFTHASCLRHPRRSLGTGNRGNDLCQPREIVGAEQRAAGGYGHDRIDASEACPCRWEPLDSLAVDLDKDILTVLTAPAVDHIEGPSAQRMERVGHLRMMNFTRPIMCIAQWFLMAPRRWICIRSPSLHASRRWFHSQTPSRQIFWRTVVSRCLSQPSRSCPRGAHAGTQRARDAGTRES